MDERTRTWLLAPPAARDGRRGLDRVATVTAGREPGHIDLVTRSGRRCSGLLTAAEGGAVRLRLALGGVDVSGGDSVLLAPGYAEVPLDVHPVEGGVRAVAAAIDVTWRPADGGLQVGALREAEYAGTLTGPGLATGVLTDADGTAAGWQLAVALGPDDAVWGGGECFQGPDLRGRVRKCVNLETHGAAGLDASYLTVPFFHSDGGWGLFAHTGTPLTADLGSTHPSVAAVEVADDVLDLFLYTGPTPSVLRQHLAVTGRPGRMPDWALGVWTSRCSYFSAEEIERVADGYAAAGCPLDVVHVDAWQVGDVVKDLSTAWEVDRDRFPAGWGKRLADRGIRLSLWHNPYLRTGTAAGDEAVARGFVLRDDNGDLVATNDMPDRLLVDFTHPGARAWWRALVADLLRCEGAASVKADFAEEVPPAARCADGRTGWQVRNSYAVAYQHESNAALREVVGDEPVMFCRSGTAGAQRYPCHWVGDTPSTWVGMAAALRACVSLSLSGFGAVASDVGGFWTEAAIAHAGAACAAFDESLFTADVDPELFLRWTQWGALSPVLRFHGTGRREPWAYPDPFGSLAVEACRVRDRMRGYLVRVAAEAAATGVSMLRPMPVAYPGDRTARDASLQYLLGADLLVAPVLAPGGVVRLWVPPGEWTGLSGAPTVTGPGWTSVDLPLAALPVWVRPGAEVLS